MDVGAVATALHGEARATDQRRLLVLHGEGDGPVGAARDALAAVPIALTDTTLVGPDDILECERVAQKRADEVMGTTRGAVVFDARDRLDPDALGTVVGAVDGGGLLVLLAPPLQAWPDRRDGFDESLAVPPHDAGDVGGRFRRRFVRTLRAHRGVAVVDVDRGVVEDDGLTHPAPRIDDDGAIAAPDDAAFPGAAYEACLTDDQVDAVRALEALSPADGGGETAGETAADGDGEPRAVVVEADRGRGKSSAAGLAAGSLAAAGRDVLVTAPERRSAGELFDRAADLLDALDRLVDRDRDAISADGGGQVRFLSPVAAVEDAGAADAVIVDEAAALSVRLLEGTLAADRVAYVTTVHGYEGAGRGFSVRFRDRLDGSDHAVTEASMVAPIRYAAGDPVEVWAFHALLLDARPPVADLVADTVPESVSYRRLSPDDLLADERLLREAFGLLVLAHYRTEPADLARLLDAPNLTLRALTHDGHVVSVALLAREGGLPADVRADMYDGGRVKGHMLPDVLTSQLRDEAAGVPEGLRVMRIATHHAVRSRGLGSALLSRVRGEFRDEVDWLGTGYGATPELLDFWGANGYRTVHLSTTRNDASGEYSALMLASTGDRGRDLTDRHEEWFLDRLPGVCSDPLDDLDPDVVRAALETVEAPAPPDLTPREWAVVAGAAYGPGLFDAAPGSFRDLVVRGLASDRDLGLDPREERLLVRKVLQADSWPAVAEDLDFHSPGQCMRALGDALVPLVDAFGDERAREVRDRFE